MQRAGFRLRDVSTTGNGQRQRLARKTQQGRLGDALAQLRITRSGLPVYAVAPGLVRALARLRRRRLWGAPVVAVVHPSVFLQDRVDPTILGLDVALTFSERIYGQMIDLGRSEHTTKLATWGPDLAFQAYQNAGDEGFVFSSGRTLRDRATLVEALRRSGHPSVFWSDVRTELPPNGEELVGPRSHADIVSVMRRSAVVAIPLAAQTHSVAGIAELNDALALGKPIVMTRSEYVDVDIERIGCGVWVQPGDIGGWESALAYVMEDDRRRAAMGLRGNTYASNYWNAARFGEAVTSAVREATRSALRT